MAGGGPWCPWFFLFAFLAAGFFFSGSFLALAAGAASSGASQPSESDVGSTWPGAAGEMSR